MNDNDIIKALKQCAAGGSCRHCPLEDELGCRMKLLEFSLEIINRQKAEIEGYGHLEVILNTAVDVLAADIKSKEIKKFAERLEDDLGDVFMVNHPCVSAIIDKLVKEMTEVRHAETD